MPEMNFERCRGVNLGKGIASEGVSVMCEVSGSFNLSIECNSGTGREGVEMR